MLLGSIMKYLAVIVIAGAVYVYLARQAPVGQAVSAVVQTSTPGSDFLKRPLDRTQEVLKTAREQAKDQP